MFTKEFKTISQIHTELKSDANYISNQKRISEIIKDPYYIPALNEVREMVQIGGWFPSDYTDQQIKFGLLLVSSLRGFHNFLIEENGKTIPSYNMPGTFIFGPLVGYIKKCYEMDEYNEVNIILTYLSELLIGTYNAEDPSHQIIEGFLNRFELDDALFRKRILIDFPESALKDYIKNRLHNIYP